MTSPHSDPSSRPPDPQHRAQLLWTGAVAIVLGLVALQQAASPVPSSTVVLSSAPEPAMTGIPVLDSPFSVGFEPAPAAPPELLPPQDASRSVAGDFRATATSSRRPGSDKHSQHP